MWFVSVEGYLMNYDCITYETKIIVPSNLEELRFEQVIDEMIAINNNLYFVGQHGNLLYEYDMVENYCNCYVIPRTEYIAWGCFSGVYLFQQYIYLFARTIGTVFRFDTVNKEFINLWAEKKGIAMRSCRMGDKVFLYGEKIACYDMISGQFEQEYSIGEGSILYLTKCGEVFYYLTKNRFSVWNLVGNSKVSMYEEKCDVEKYGIFFLTKHKVFVLPSESKDILILNRQSGALLYDNPPDDMVYVEKGWSKYWGYTEDDRYIWCANRVCNYVLCIDKESEGIKWIKLKLPELKEEIPYLELKMKLANKTFFSECEMPVEQFMLCIKKQELTNCESNSYGKRIWEMLEE